MRRALGILALAAAAAGCNQGPDASALPTRSGPTPFDAGTPPPPMTIQTGAPGLCGSWSVVPVDLGVVGAPGVGSKLRIHADARGGFTVQDQDAHGTWTAAAFTSGGQPDGAPLVLAPSAFASADQDAGTPTFVDALAIPGGWVVSQYGYPDGTALVTRGLTGNPTVTRAVLQPYVAPALEGLADGTVLVAGGVEGTEATWLSPGETGDVGFVFVADAALSAWSSGIFYAFDGTTLQSATRAGVTRAIPSTTAPRTATMFVPGTGGTSAMALVPSTTDLASAQLVFLSAARPDAVFTFDQEIAHVAGAARDQSGGAVLAWTTQGLTASGGVAYGFTEVSPIGARGQVIGLGNEVVTSATVQISRSGDGTAYLTVAQNVNVREAFVLTCND